MSNSSPDFSFESPLDSGLCLELAIGENPEAAPGNVVRALASAPFSTPGGALRSRLNRLSLETVQAWLREDLQIRGRSWPSDRSLPSIWEWLNGTMLQVNQQRWLLLPTLAIDHLELRVPQEWVDIPEWIADYYLGIQINEAEGYLKIWGYGTHAQLKQLGQYDPEDRTYSLDSDQLLQSLDALSFAADAPALQATQATRSVTRSEVSVLAPVELTQAQNLIQRLTQAETLFPRLSIPFVLWGALLRHDGWRQRLYEARNGLPETRSVTDWFRAGVSAIAEGWGWQMGAGFAMAQPETPAIAMRSIESTRESEGDSASVGQAVSLPLRVQGQTLQLQISPLGDRPNAWRFSLVSATAGEMIPRGTTLRLLTEDLQPFEHNEDQAEEDCQQLYVDVQLEENEGLIWEINPIPENYVREILRF